MIPSDHFVRFYNEVFKFLDAHNGLKDYYSHISHHQEFHCLKDFREKKIQGIYEYYLKIRKEENCDMDINLIADGHGIELKMNTCPSLSKAINNDAGACPKYCLHCPGWTAPLYSKAGLFQVYDVMGLDHPRCDEWIFDNKDDAEKLYQELLKSRPASELLRNYAENEPEKKT